MHTTSSIQRDKPITWSIFLTSGCAILRTNIGNHGPLEPIYNKLVILDNTRDGTVKSKNVHWKAQMYTSEKQQMYTLKGRHVWVVCVEDHHHRGCAKNLCTNPNDHHVHMHTHTHTCPWSVYIIRCMIILYWMTWLQLTIKRLKK